MADTRASAMTRYCIGDDSRALRQLSPGQSERVGERAARSVAQLLYLQPLDVAYYSRARHAAWVMEVWRSTSSNPSGILAGLHLYE